MKKSKKLHKNCSRDQTLLFCTRHYLGRQGVALAGTRQLRSQGLVPVHAHRTEEVIGSENRKYRTGSGAGSELRVGTEMGTGNEVEANVGAQDENKDRSGDEAGTGTGTGVDSLERTQDGNGDRSRDGNESNSGDGNGNEDGKVDDDKVGEKGGEAKKRKKTHKICSRHVGNGGDLGGKRNTIENNKLVQ